MWFIAKSVFEKDKKGYGTKLNRTSKKSIDFQGTGVGDGSPVVRRVLAQGGGERDGVGEQQLSGLPLNQ